MDLDWGTILTGLVIGIPSALLGYLAHRRARKVDAVAEQSGIATETRAGTDQIIQGFKDLITKLQEDNRDNRADIKGYQDVIARLEIAAIECGKTRLENQELKLKLAWLEKKLGGEGVDTPIPPSPKSGRHRA